MSSHTIFSKTYTRYYITDYCLVFKNHEWRQPIDSIRNNPLVLPPLNVVLWVKIFHFLKLHFLNMNTASCWCGQARLQLQFQNYNPVSLVVVNWADNSHVSFLYLRQREDGVNANIRIRPIGILTLWLLTLIYTYLIFPCNRL